MLFVFLTVVVPFLLFVGGAYLLHYPVSLGFFYGLNMALMYLVLWKVVNQVIKIQTQKMGLSGCSLVLSCKQLFTSPPVFRHLDLEVPLSRIRTINLLPTRLGYLLTIRFEQEGKMMGLDMDLNPLRLENKDVLRQVLTGAPEVEIDQETENVLNRYADRVRSWKGSYAFSLAVLGLALTVFLLISLYLGRYQG